jgi:succinate dehydrogenase/fumarate reductase flavoprotein subunit
MRTAEKFDALVLGTGLAGLNFALEFANRWPSSRVLVITKSADLPSQI